MSEAAQWRLLQGSAVVLGIQETGAVVAQHLAQAGIGKLELVDDNPKALSALYRTLVEMPGKSADTQINCRFWHFDGHDAEQRLAEGDVIIDGLQSWQDKLIASDICMLLNKPLVHAGGSGFRFQVFTMVPSQSACLRCAFPQVGIDDVPLTTDQVASFGPVLGLVGSLQALSAIKLIARLGATQGNELLKIDCLSGEFEVITGLDKRPDCPDCGRNLRA